MINQNGTVNSRNYFYPFGGNRGGAAFSSLTTKRFTGQYHEQGLPGGEGLSYYGARWYDAQLGRFASPDTIVPGAGNPQAFNRYSYANNNPVRYLDPTGHVANCFCTMQQDAGGGGGSSAANHVYLPIVSNNHDYNERTASLWWASITTATYAVSDFAYGAAAQWGYNNSWYSPTYQRRFAEQPGESVAITVGRHVANIGSMAQGAVEVAGGGSLATTGAVACGTGILCLAGAPAIAGGAAAVAHGGTVTGVGIYQEIRMLSNVMMAWTGGGSESSSGYSDYDGNRQNLRRLTDKEVRKHGLHALKQQDGVPADANLYVDETTGSVYYQVNERNAPYQWFTDVANLRKSR